MKLKSIKIGDRLQITNTKHCKNGDIGKVIEVNKEKNYVVLRYGYLNGIDTYRLCPNNLQRV